MISSQPNHLPQATPSSCPTGGQDCDTCILGAHGRAVHSTEGQHLARESALPQPPWGPQGGQCVTTVASGAAGELALAQASAEPGWLQPRGAGGSQLGPTQLPTSSYGGGGDGRGEGRAGSWEEPRGGGQPRGATCGASCVGRGSSEGRAVPHSRSGDPHLESRGAVGLCAWGAPGNTRKVRSCFHVGGAPGRQQLRGCAALTGAGCPSRRELSGKSGAALDPGGCRGQVSAEAEAA